MLRQRAPVATIIFVAANVCHPGAASMRPFRVPRFLLASSFGIQYSLFDCGHLDDFLLALVEMSEASMHEDHFSAVWEGDVPCAVETQRQLGSRLRNHL